MAKRTAEYQLTQENFESEEEEDRDNVGEFSKASGDVMAKRVIKKAKKRIDGSGTSNGNSVNIFSGFMSSARNNGISSMGSSIAGASSAIAFGSPLQGVQASSTPNLFGKAESSSNLDDNAVKIQGQDQVKGEKDTTANVMKENPIKDIKDSPGAFSQKDKDTLYGDQIAALNMSFLNWINLHVEKNPIVDLTPVFKDYSKYMDDIELKYGKSSPVGVEKSSVVTSVRAATGEKDEAKNFTSRIGDNSGVLKSETGSSPFADFSQPKTSDAPFKTSVAGFFSMAQTSTPTISVGESKLKEEDKKEEDEGEVPDDYEMDERKTVIDEDAFYTTRCKLFFKKVNDWKELGVGMLYLKSLNDGKTQLLVRMETAAGKVLLNISLQKNLPVARVGKNNVSVMCVPNPPVFLKEADGDNTKPLNYLIRVKGAEDADKLLKLINDNKERD